MVSNVINNKTRVIKLVKVLVVSGTLAALVGIVQFILQFALGLDRTYFFWATIIKPFFRNQFFGGGF